MKEQIQELKNLSDSTSQVIQRFVVDYFHLHLKKMVKSDYSEQNIIQKILSI